LWENATPVFADINPETGCIDATNIEQLITPNTQAIMPVHVYGLPCEVEKIEEIAQKHNLKVIYDAAHAFGVKYKNKPLVNYGNLSTLSFHATKLFHTVEGGAIITNNNDEAKQLKLLRAFGHINDDYFGLGINAKMSELHAAMGLALLDEMPKIIQARKIDDELYKKHLQGLNIHFFKIPQHTEYNYSYFPVLFENEQTLLKVKNDLYNNGINARRYFYPSLNTLPHLAYQPCPKSEDIAKRVLCLPHFYGNNEETITKFCNIIKRNL
jgi:dTDP-4-amino-4,6-dideoxygalactose transaminase